MTCVGIVGAAAKTLVDDALYILQFPAVAVFPSH